jgi:predicted enzyme related to lactoylglutathione lyase
MSTVTQHAPGTFCWPELASSVSGAKKFYTALFGWPATHSPIGEGATYTMLALGDRAVGALHQMRAADHPAGTPSHWFSYIAVADADAAAAKVAGLGGTVLRQPFDVMDAGRMAIVLDPIGAVFGLWQAGKHAGAQVLGEPGALGWTQLNANHPDQAIPFYAGLFNWNARRDPTAGGGTYTTWSIGSVSSCA